MRAALIFASILVLAACNSAGAQKGEAGSRGSATERRFDVGAFDEVSLSGPYDVVVTVGPAASVRAEGEAEDLERMEIVVENGGLKIRRKREGLGFGSGQRAPVTVHVTVPALRGAAIGGSGDMRIDKVEGPSFAAAVGGSGDMKIDAMRVDKGNFSVAGSGGITAAGVAADAAISVAGSGDVDLKGVELRTASVSVVGSGNVETRASESADVSIAGSGNVTVGGTAKCSVSKMGSGEVRCGA